MKGLFLITYEYVKDFLGGPSYFDEEVSLGSFLLSFDFNVVAIF